MKNLKDSDRDMTCEVNIEEALRALPKEFICEKIDENVWLVTTPFEYPDGDLIQIYIIKKDNYFELTDYAETIRSLKNLDFEIFASKRRQKLFDEILRSFNVIYWKGELRLSATSENLTRAILNLSQAIFRVSDLIFSYRAGIRVTFKEEVEELLKELDVDYDPDYQVTGRSGKIYTIDFCIYLPKKPDLVMTISTWTKNYAERLVDKIVRMWYDIKRMDGRFDYVTIIDDRSDVWKDYHFELLGDLSDVYVWSKIDEFKERIITKKATI